MKPKNFEKIEVVAFVRARSLILSVKHEAHLSTKLLLC